MSVYSGALGAGSLGSLVVVLAADNTNLVSGMQMASYSVARGAASMEQSFRSLSGTITAFATASTLALAGFEAASAKSFVAFDDAMTRSTAIMGEAGTQMRKQLEENAREISRNSLFSAEELAKRYLTLSSAGLNAEQSIQALNVVQKFATAGQMDLEKATNLLIQSQTALGLRMKDPTDNMQNMVRLADLLTKANILAQGTTEDFAEALANRAASSMRTFGISAEEGIAVLAGFANVGVTGKVAGEQFSIVLRDMQKALLNNRVEFEHFNVQVYKAGQLRPIADILKDLERALSNMGAEEKRATLGLLGFQDRSQNALLSVLGLSEQIRGFDKDLKTSSGTMEEVDKKIMASFASQFTVVKNRVLEVAISLGQSFAPALESLINLLKEATDKNSAFFQVLQSFNDEVASNWVKNIIDYERALLRVVNVFLKELPNAVLAYAEVYVRTLNAIPGWLSPATAMLGKGLDFDKTISKLNDWRTQLKDLQKTAVDDIPSELGDAGVKAFKKLDDAAAEAKRAWDASVGAISLKANQQMDLMNAPTMRDFLNHLDKEGFGTGQPKSILAEESRKGLESFQDQTTNQAFMIAKEQEMNKMRLDEIKKIKEQEVMLNEETHKRMLQALMIYSEREKQIRRSTNQFILHSASSIFGDLATIAETWGGKQNALYMSLFAASKAFAIAESTIKIMQGVAEAAALPWPLNLGAIASVAAATANIVSTIASTTLQLSGANGARQFGGSVDRNNAYIVGENGPELFVPQTSGTVVANGKMASSVKVNIHNYSNIVPEVNTRQDEDGKVIDIVLRRVEEKLSSGIRNGTGSLPKAMEQSYRLRRGTR